MSPPVSLVGFVSIPTVWVITTLSLPSEVWTFGVIPLLSICFICDQRKLRQIAVQVKGSQLLFIGSPIVVLYSILYARFAYIRFILWKVAVVVVWLLCMMKAFHSEKQMYLTDTIGAVAKYLVWEVITRFTGETMWMNYTSEWALCSPYSRKLVHKDIDHYYNLRKRAEEQEIIPENYEFNFQIESCHLHTVYTAASEDRGDAGHGDYSTSSAVGSGPREDYPSPMPGVGPFEFKERAETGSASSTALSTEGESSSSSKVERGPLVTDSYTLVSSHDCNKVEVSLKYENKTLEGYTFYNIAYDAVAEFKRVLEVLKDEGNIIFSTLYKNIGSSRPRAHARCHEFRELLQLILNDSYKLHEVDLRAKYKCIISGHWVFQLQNSILIGVTIGINYYQLTGPPKDVSVVIILLTIYALSHLFVFLVTFAFSVEMHKLKRLVYFVIRRIRPRNVDDWYRYFQVHFPLLTFPNESYCYPYVSSQKEICFLRGTLGCFPVIDIEPARYFHMEDLREGFRYFNLRNLELEVTVTYILADEVQVDVQMRRTYDGRSCCYPQFFHADRRKAADFIALMTWLQENRCVGVCKEWPESGLMYAYRYTELFHKVLVDGLKPMISKFTSPIDITVE